MSEETKKHPNKRLTNVQFAKLLDHLRNQREAVQKLSKQSDVAQFLVEAGLVNYALHSGTIQTLLKAANITLARCKRAPRGSGTYSGKSRVTKTLMVAIANLYAQLGLEQGEELSKVLEEYGLKRFTEQTNQS